MYLVFFFLILVNSFQAVAQPGYREQAYIFTMHKDFQNYILQWRVNQSEWQQAVKKENTFTTAPITLKNEAAIELKLYKKNNVDTMYIVTQKSLHQIEYVPGRYDVTGAAGYLFNLVSEGDTKIINRFWKNVNSTYRNLPTLQKTRQVYLKKSLYPFEMNEPDVFYSTFQPSFHIKATDPENYEDWLTLGKIYYDPKKRNHYYCVAYYTNVEDAPSDDEYYWLLESTDGLQSWQKKFPLMHNVLELLNFKNDIFSFAAYNKKDEIVKYDAGGNLIASTAYNGAYCNIEENQFYNCDKHIFPFADGSKSISTPMMDGDNSQHIYHTYFTQDQKSILLTQLPYIPSKIQCHYTATNELLSVVKLMTHETYVYLTQRKNKLVLLSYHYTLVSNDFGKSWTFYANGLIAGGSWNVFWLDDNRLASMTNLYTDVVLIP